jgi:hypothetical protein
VRRAAGRREPAGDAGAARRRAGLPDAGAGDRGALAAGGTPAPEEERGLRWNDPLVGIDWPERPAEMSEKDRTWPDFDPAFHGIERLRGLR